MKKLRLTVSKKIFQQIEEKKLKTVSVKNSYYWYNRCFNADGSLRVGYIYLRYWIDVGVPIIRAKVKCCTERESRIVFDLEQIKLLKEDE